MPEAKRLELIIAKVELQNIRLLESTARTRIRRPGEAGKAGVFITTAAKVAVPFQKSGEFVIHATASAVVSAKAASPSPFVQVEGVFELSYRLPSEVAPTTAELHAFASANAVFNAWPYWRELFQTLSTRMDLPPITLPLFRLVGTEQNSAENPNKTANPESGNSAGQRPSKRATRRDRAKGPSHS